MHCLRCGTSENLHNHHKNVWRPGLRKDRSWGEEIICLCSDCHAFVHSYSNSEDEFLNVTKNRPSDFPELHGETYGGDCHSQTQQGYGLTEKERQTVRSISNELKGLMTVEEFISKKRLEPIPAKLIKRDCSRPVEPLPVADTQCLGYLQLSLGFDSL
jgi:hypothetical protein